jgi:hypothetical protein
MSPGSSWIVLLIAKIVVSAGFVLGVTAAVERLGPRLGALIAATPQLSVVALIFFTLEQGPAFAAESAFWTIPGMCATIPVFLGYLVAVWLVPGPRIRSVIAGVALGTLGFILSSSLLGALPLTRGTIFPLAVAVCAGTAWMVRRLPDTAILKRAPASPLILATRAGASVLTVVTVTSLAHLLGPKWSGLVAGFPVNGLPVMAILHYQYGADVIKPFIRIFPAGAFGICLFNLVASVCLVPLGLVATITLAYGVDIAYLIAVSRLGRPSRPGRSS